MLANKNILHSRVLGLALTFFLVFATMEIAKGGYSLYTSDNSYYSSDVDIDLGYKIISGEADSDGWYDEFGADWANSVYLWCYLKQIGPGSDSASHEMEARTNNQWTWEWAGGGAPTGGALEWVFDACGAVAFQGENCFVSGGDAAATSEVYGVSEYSDYDEYYNDSFACGCWGSGYLESIITYNQQAEVDYGFYEIDVNDQNVYHFGEGYDTYILYIWWSAGGDEGSSTPSGTSIIDFEFEIYSYIDASSDVVNYDYAQTYADTSGMAQTYCDIDVDFTPHE